ncbi:MAG: hypothetical protein CM15mP111_4590 [Hyphomicrobiales bacterium]|nr:MAG: hypothetical protein CM15mP111_4590 [Hyphomicrobiales bacterium]
MLCNYSLLKIMIWGKHNFQKIGFYHLKQFFYGIHFSDYPRGVNLSEFWINIISTNLI